MKKIFAVDWSLLLCFLLTVITGFGMHMAGHGTSHAWWEIWAWMHSLTGVSFVGFAVWHAKMHTGWYKALFKGKPSKKRHVTVALTVIAFMAAMTGVVMFAIAGANSDIGMWHYRIGILLSVLAIGHILKRMSILRKSAKS